MLRPYVKYSIIGTCLLYVSMLIAGDSNWIHYVLSPFKQLLLSGAVAGNAALWFLPSLFAVRCLACILHNDNDKRNIFAALTFAVLAALLSLCPVRLPVYFANVMSGMFFFTMGNILNEKQYINKWYWIVLAVYVAFMCTPLKSYVDMRANNVTQGYYCIWLLSSLIGCMLINNIFRRFPVLQFRLLSSVGKDSMNYYVMHWPVLLVMKIIAVQLLHYENDTLLAAIYVAACIISLPLLNMMIKRLEARPQNRTF